MSSGPQSSVLFLALLAVVVLALVFPTGKVEARSYGIRSLSHANCLSLNHMDGTLGDDRSPMVVGLDAVYYSGDTKVGSIDPSDLTISSSSSAKIDGLFSDLGDGSLWTLATSETDWYGYDVEEEDDPQSEITHLIPLYPGIAGNLLLDQSRPIIALSQPLNPSIAQPGLFQGMGEFIFASRISAPEAASGVFLVTIATGEVTRVHTFADGQAWDTVPPLRYTENFGRWGVLERHGDKLYTTGSVDNNDDDIKGIYRYNLDGTLNSKIYEGDLSDAGVFAVTYFHLSSGTTPRWYTHGEGGLVNADFAGSGDWNEWLLACDADLYYSESSASSVPCALCSLWASLFA